MYQSQAESGRLLWSIKSGLLNVVKSLLSQGIDADTRDENGDTALMVAIAESKNINHKMRNECYNGNIKMVKLLIQEGANIEATSKYGNTPLICAAHHGETEIVELLLKYGANIEAKGKHGNTAILAAAHKNHEDTVKFLMKKGANVSVTNYFNQTIDDLLDNSNQLGNQYESSQADDSWGWGSVLLAGAAVIGGSMMAAAAMQQQTQERKLTGHDEDSDTEI